MSNTTHTRKRPRGLMVIAAVTVLMLLGGLSPVDAPAKRRLGSAGSTITLTSGKLTITFAPNVYRPLTQTDLGTINTVTVIRPATLTSSGVATFPVVGGEFNTRTLRGAVRTHGGLTFSSTTTPASGTQTTTFSLENFSLVLMTTSVPPGTHLPTGVSVPTPLLNATEVAPGSGPAGTVPNYSIATLSRSAVTNAPHGEALKLSAFRLALTDDGDTVFSLMDPAVNRGTVIGTVSLTAHG